MHSLHSKLSLIVLASSLLAAVGVQTHGAGTPSLLREQPFIESTFGEAGKSFRTTGQRVEILADRYVYQADDVDGQFFVLFLGKVKPADAEKLAIQLELKDAKSGKVIETKFVSPVRGPKLPVIIPTSELRPGHYELAATLKDTSGNVVAQAARKFERSAKSDKSPKFPAKGIPIYAHAQSHVPDGEWPITTGVPMPKSAMMNVDGLALLENGKPVPAQFIIRARWSPNGWVKWVGVDFVAKYDKGKPREYRLMQSSAKKPTPAKPLSVQESDEKLVVDTGVAKFEINRKQFAGIEKAWIGDKLVVDGHGGSFVVDEQGKRYDSAHSKDVKVIVEESGPVQTTIAAKGWYANDTGEPLCQFVIRFKAYAGQPFVMVSHRMVNTIADRYVPTRLADVGFEVVPGGKIERWRYGFDGKSHEGSGGVFLHQDRGDHFRLMQGEKQIVEGKRSDGWVTAQTATGSVTYFLRDVYQKFPKELEIDASADKAKLIAHFWPKHGHVVFNKTEEIARDQIYKVRWAHQGKLLEFPIPDYYHNRLVELDKEENWTAGGGELVIVDHKKNITKVQNASGQGTVIGNELVIRLDAAPQTPDTLRAHAALIQQSPHALADAEWNCATGVLGAVAPRDPKKFEPAEKLMDDGYEFYRRAIIEAGDEYGMWIYGGVHSSWEADKNYPSLKRVWQQSHYQNVFQAWLLYFRSGSPEHFEWARMHSSQHLDIGVCNYRMYPKGTHSYSHIGDMGGDIYHCKGFMPWAGNSSTQGHWIDLANYFYRYYLTGDRRGLDMAETWMATVSKMTASNKPNVPSTLDGYQNDKKMEEVEAYRKQNPKVKKEDWPKWMLEESEKAALFNPREEFVPLGEITQLYEATWDPQVLIHLSNQAEYLNLPFEQTSSPSLSTFGKHWQDWYWNLTRDPRTIVRVREYMEAQRRRNRQAGYPSFAAFLYHATGDESYVKDCVSDSFEDVLNVYECEGDRYDGFCLTHSNPAAMLIGRLPYILHAMDTAGLKFERSDATTSVPNRGGRVDYADKRLLPPRGWSNTGVTVLTRTPKPTKIAVSIFGPGSFGNLRGGYRLFYGFPELDAFKRPDAAALLKKRDDPTMLKFDSTDCFDDPPEQRQYGSTCRGEPMVFPYVERPNHDPAKLEYRLEHGGSAINLPAFIDADTQKPLPQIAVIPRTTFGNLKTNESSSYSMGVMDAYFRPLDANAIIDLRITSQLRRYAAPTRVQVWDARGNSLLDSSVFMAGQRKEVTVTLDPAKNPLPWRVMMVSQGDNHIRFSGADELFFARKPEEFGKILPHIPIYRP